MSNDAKTQFVEQVGLAFQADGLPRIAGRMFGFFVAFGGTHSFSQLAERLQVSRGSISTNARILERLGTLEKTARPGDRQDYFRLTDDPYVRLLEGYRDRIDHSRAMVRKTLAALPNGDDARQRLTDMERFYDTAYASVSQNLASRSRKRS